MSEPVRYSPSGAVPGTMYRDGDGTMVTLADYARLRSAFDELLKLLADIGTCGGVPGIAGGGLCVGCRDRISAAIENAEKEQ